VRFPSEPRITGDQHLVEQMIDAGMTFGEVEDAIERLPAGDEKKSALWLTAWLRLSSSGPSHIAAPAPVRVGTGA
jgi:hypothetical protein